MARILDHVVGHETVISSLLSAVADDKLPAQFVFFGTEGIGKKQVALGLIQALFCEEIGEQLGACGKCGSCLRVENKTAENLLCVSPEKNLIKIEQSHGILDFLSLGAWSTSSSKVSKRAILIDDAHGLNAQAANALLKIFEEPPEHTYFFLITHRQRLLLSTVRSRAKMVGFRPLSFEQMQKLKPQAEKWQLLSARGSLQKFLSLTDAHFSEIRIQAVQCLSLLLKSPEEFSISNWRDQLKDREVASQFLKWWMCFLRDAAMSDDSQIVAQDQMPVIELLRTFSIEKIHELFSLILRAESGLWVYQDPVLLVENVFLSGFYRLGEENEVD